MNNQQNDMMNENEVVIKTMQALSNAGWTIRRNAMTHQSGEDIVADRSGRPLYVEAKGVTSSKPGTRRYGKPQTPSQFLVSTAVAVLKAAEIRTQHPDAMVAIALPDHPRMQARIERIKPVLEAAKVGVLWTNFDGTVREWNLAAL